jgi:hypothetical protein
MRRVADAAGWAVLDEALTRLRAALGGRLVAFYAVGSLTHGGFAPDVSDVDGVAIVDRTDAEIADVVRGVRVDGDLGARLSLFWGDWETFAVPPTEARLPPIVRLDLLRHGLALLGAGPPPLAEPTPTELIASGRRPLTKTILFPVRFLATLHAGLAGSNDEAAEWYIDDHRPHAPLVAAAIRWRTQPLEPGAQTLVAAHLPGLIAEARAAYGLDD